MADNIQQSKKTVIETVLGSSNQQTSPVVSSTREMKEPLTPMNQDLVYTETVDQELTSDSRVVKPAQAPKVEDSSFNLPKVKMTANNQPVVLVPHFAQQQSPSAAYNLPKSLRFEGTVLAQNRESKERLERRQKAAELLSQITLGKKNMRYHSLKQIENQIQREYQQKIGIMPTVSVQRTIVKDGNKINVQREVKDSSRTQNQHLLSKRDLNNANMQTLYGGAAKNSKRQSSEYGTHSSPSIKLRKSSEFPRQPDVTQPAVTSESFVGLSTGKGLPSSQHGSKIQEVEQITNSEQTQQLASIPIRHNRLTQVSSIASMESTQSPKYLTSDKQDFFEEISKRKSSVPVDQLQKDKQFRSLDLTDVDAEGSPGLRKGTNKDSREELQTRHKRLDESKDMPPTAEGRFPWVDQATSGAVEINTKISPFKVKMQAATHHPAKNNFHQISNKVINLEADSLMQQLPKLSKQELSAVSKSIQVRQSELGDPSESFLSKRRFTTNDQLADVHPSFLPQPKLAKQNSKKNYKQLYRGRRESHQQIRHYKPKYFGSNLPPRKSEMHVHIRAPQEQSRLSQHLSSQEGGSVHEISQQNISVMSLSNLPKKERVNQSIDYGRPEAGGPSRNILRDISRDSISQLSHEEVNAHSSISPKGHRQWNFLHPRYRVVTQADNIMRREQEYIHKLRSKNHLTEKAYQEAVKSGAASLRWQDSVSNLHQKRTSENTLPMQTEEAALRRELTQQLSLFLVLLPKGGVKHSPIFSRCVQIKSHDFHACDDVDFLNLCREIFQEPGKLNYIYDSEGKMIERVSAIKDKSILFVKRDPGFNLSEKDFNHVIRTLEREQRVRSKLRLEGIEDDPEMVKFKTLSNYQKLIDEQLRKQSQLETWELHPRNFSKAKKSKVNKKLWRYAKEVMEMEIELQMHPNKELEGVTEHKFDLGSKRQAKVITGVRKSVELQKDFPPQLSEEDKTLETEEKSKPTLWLHRDDSFQILLEQSEEGEQSNPITRRNYIESSERTSPSSLNQQLKTATQAQQIKSEGPKLKYIRAKGGSKVPLHRVIEMDEADKDKVNTLKQQETYNMVKSEESLQKLIEDQQKQDLLNVSSGDESDELAHGMKNTREYFRKIQQDIDTSDLLQNEVKIRKLYNIVHKQKIPESRLSKQTQKRFKQLEEAVAKAQQRRQQSATGISIFSDN